MPKYLILDKSKHPSESAKLLQFFKAFLYNVLTLLKLLIFVNDVQFQNASWANIVVDGLNVISFKFVQPLKLYVLETESISLWEFVKYLNSLKYSIFVLFWKVVPNIISAASDSNTSLLLFNLKITVFIALSSNNI